MLGRANLRSEGESAVVMQSSESTRNASVDVLRSFSMVLVVLLHVAAPYATSGLEAQEYNSAFWIGNIINSFCRVCVPLFVMISGAFLLGRNEPYAFFYRKRAARVLWPLVFWSGAYVLYLFLMQYIGSGELQILPVVNRLLIGKPFYHLWYMYMLIGLYLITPIINRAIQSLELQELKRVAYIMLAVGFLINLWNAYFKNDSIFILWFAEYIGYFLMGYFIINSHKKWSSIGHLAVYGVSSLLIAAMTYFFKDPFFYNYLFPLVILASLSIFKLFSQNSLHANWLSRFSKLTLGVYLIHAGILDIIRLLSDRLELTTGFTVLDVLIKFCLVFGISLTLASLISRLPRLNRVI